ncbi:MAG: hypothetical protein ACI81F_002622 [Thalassolituus oleivorans]|jgi:hypothetical protein
MTGFKVLGISITKAGIAGVLTLAASTVYAIDAQGVRVHGFFSQAATVSKNVNVRGDSTHGSFDFTEIGINISAPIMSNLRAAGQVVSVKTGADKSSEPEIDFLLMDWTFIDSGTSNGGLRLGKVRLPNGLHYPARDVAAVRPGIFMPQSVYLDNLGSRAFLYSTEGVQFYFNTFGENVRWQFIGHYISDQEVSERVELAALRRALPGAYRITNGAFVSIRRDSLARNLTHSLTHGWAENDYKRASADPVNSSFIDYSETIYSLQYTLERFQLTTELDRRAISLGLDSSFATISDKYVSFGAYIEARFIPTESFEWFIRYDELNQQAGDRRGVERSKKTGLPRHYSFARDTSVGARYGFGNGVSLLGEFHYVDGLETADASDNDDYLTGQLSRYWSYASVMMAYRF